MKIANTFLAIGLLHLSVYTYAQEMPNNKGNLSNKPTCDCDSLWKKSDTQEFVKYLEWVTSYDKSIWPGYRLSDASFVINAGKIIGGEHCLGLWKKGKILSYAKFAKTLIMLTPLYSYYLNYKEMDSIPDNDYFKTSENAPELRLWLQQMNVSSAVYMPLDFSKLPFTLPTITKVQLAIHEAFHVEVMLKYWFTKRGNWPKWDKQPDRKNVQICYTYNDTGRVMIQKELSLLAEMIEALLDKKKDSAYILGQKYIKARESRYEKLEGVKPKLADNVDGDCRTAESLFELEEGLADYESWTVLFNIKVASREELLKRYRAKQKDHFYLSGCMLMHAITLMSKETPEKVISKMINTTSIEEGSLLTIFENKLKEWYIK